MATHATTWFGVLSEAAGTLSVGYAVVENDDGQFVVATSANRTLYGRSWGVAITAADSSVPSFEYQVAGVLHADVTGIASGTEGDWVIVNASGQLERDATPDAGEDVIGRCLNDEGDIQIMPGTWDSSNVVGGGGGGVTFAGDLSGNSTSQTVEKVKGTTITTAGGALAVGAVLRTTAVGTADWGAVNLADTDAVTGTLPTANQAAQSMGGDCSGTTAACTVAKVNGTTITTAGGALAVGAVLRTTAAGTADWGAVNLADTDAVTGSLPIGNLGAPTGTGLATVTSGAWDAASSSVAAGFLTWAATPSSANLASLVTDETGTGALFFAGGNFGAATGTSAAVSSFWSTGASPATTGAGRMSNNTYIYALDSTGLVDIRLIGLTNTNTVVVGGINADINMVTNAGHTLTFGGDSHGFYSASTSSLWAQITSSALTLQTGVLLKLADSTGGQFYTFSPSNLAADRTITLPLLTGNDTMVTEAHAATLTNKTLTSPTINGAATSGTWSGTPTFSGRVTFSAGLNVGATVASAGSVRWANATDMKARLADNSGDFDIIFCDASNNISVGNVTNTGDTYIQSGSDNYYRAPTHNITSTGGTAFLTITASAITANVAIVQKTSAMGALAIDWALGNVFTKTLAAGGNTITFSNDTDGQVISVVLTSNAGGSTVTWPAGVQWPDGGTEPTQTSTGKSIYTLLKAGGVVYGVHQGNFA
jgi:hypothetical protein